SVILVVGQRGKLKLQTVSHSPVGLAVEAGLLDEDEALHHHERHLILNAVGFAEMRIELGAPLPLARHDTVLLARDGLTDNLTLDEIVAGIRKGPLGEAVAALTSLARQRMLAEQPGSPCKPDDLT
ncbi:MAG: serine/threonine protein phosphatase, partial [Akkermansiaceae bacterium]|nr:serine/threonine protein phosphatase [Akkermansiaceae bacterium]